MQVNPSGTYPQTGRTSAAPRATNPATGGSTAPAAEANSFMPTGDLARLLTLARSAPEVRADVVAAAAARAASGELSTPAAAADTARAMLAAGD